MKQEDLQALGDMVRRCGFAAVVGAIARIARQGKRRDENLADLAEALETAIEGWD